MATSKGAEPLQFDFGGGDAARDEPVPAERVETEPVPAGARPVRLPALDRRSEGLRIAREALETGGPPPPEAAIELAAAVDDEEAAGAASDAALTVAAFYDRLKSALRREFVGEVWVTGEIRKVTVSKGHHYLELADHDPTASEGGIRGGFGGGRTAPATLEAACWARDWPAIAAALDAVGVELAAGMVVRVRGKVSIWEAGARIRFTVTGLDVEALVGGIAAARRALLGALAAEGVIDANRRLAVPLVPLRIGLVTSAGTEAYRDVTGQLERSGFAFEVRLESSLVQGADAPAQLAEAIGRLHLLDLDLIVVVRGGGAKGDLAAFDHELVARAIVGSRLPVWTGIGHTGDRSVADEVAQRSLVTPTACGEAVVDAVGAFLDRLEEQAGRLAQIGRRNMEVAARELDTARSQLGSAARHDLDRADHALAGRRGLAQRGAAIALERCAGTLSRRAAHIASASRSRVAAAAADLDRRRAVLGGFDPRRQMERGWSLTRRADGSVLRRAADVGVGEELVTVLADGTVRSVAESVTVRDGHPA